MNTAITNSFTSTLGLKQASILNATNKITQTAFPKKSDEFISSTENTSGLKQTSLNWKKIGLGLLGAVGLAGAGKLAGDYFQMPALAIPWDYTIGAAYKGLSNLFNGGNSNTTEVSTLAPEAEPVLMPVPSEVQDENNKLVVLDVGHGKDNTGNGKFDPGAMYGNVSEREIIEKFGSETARQLQAAGYQVEIIDSGTPAKRAYYIENLYKPDAHISLHADSFPDQKVRGQTAFIYGDQHNNIDYSLAKILQGSTTQNTGTKDRGVHINNSLAMLNKTPNTPSAYLEVGFGSNNRDLKNLQDPRYVGNFARGVVDGMNEYFSTR